MSFTASGDLAAVLQSSLSPMPRITYTMQGRDLCKVISSATNPNQA